MPHSLQRHDVGHRAGRPALRRSRALHRRRAGGGRWNRQRLGVPLLQPAAGVRRLMGSYIHQQDNQGRVVTVAFL